MNYGHSATIAGSNALDGTETWWSCFPSFSNLWSRHDSLNTGKVRQSLLAPANEPPSAYAAQAHLLSNQYQVITSQIPPHCQSQNPNSPPREFFQIPIVDIQPSNFSEVQDKDVCPVYDIHALWLSRLIENKYNLTSPALVYRELHSTQGHLYLAQNIVRIYYESRNNPNFDAQAFKKEVLPDALAVILKESESPLVKKTVRKHELTLLQLNDKEVHLLQENRLMNKGILEYTGGTLKIKKENG